MSYLCIKIHPKIYKSTKIPKLTFYCLFTPATSTTKLCKITKKQPDENKGINHPWKFLAQNLRIDGRVLVIGIWFRFLFHAIFKQICFCVPSKLLFTKPSIKNLFSFAFNYSCNLNLDGSVDVTQVERFNFGIRRYYFFSYRTRLMQQNFNCHNKSFVHQQSVKPRSFSFYSSLTFLCLDL